MMQMDFKAAFLNGELSEEIYMEQPQGFVVRNKEHDVYRLMKAVYGFKPASKAWRKHLNILLKSFGCELSAPGGRMYFKKNNGEVEVTLIV